MKKNALHPMTRQELADHLGMSYSTFRRMIKSKGLKLGRKMLSPRMVKTICLELGYPAPEGHENLNIHV